MVHVDYLKARYLHKVARHLGRNRVKLRQDVEVIIISELFNLTPGNLLSLASLTKRHDFRLRCAVSFVLRTMMTIYNKSMRLAMF